MEQKRKRAALEIAEIASKAACGFFRRELEISFKADESPVTHADRHIEHLVRAYLAEHFPQDGIFGEEHGFDGREREKIWIIDPIDGTRSFMSGNPLFGFLLACLDRREPQIGVIGMPALGETLLGIAGQGATLNGRPITTSSCAQLERATLYVNEANRIYQARPDLFSRLMSCGQTLRMGHDCYPHALVAAGYCDAVIDFDLQPYDYLAISAVVCAAGGVVTDWQGRPLTLSSDGSVITAATAQLHAELLQIIAG